MDELWRKSWENPGDSTKGLFFQGVCVSILQRRSWHHFQQLGDLLRVAGGAGSDATAEAVDGRAKAVQPRDKRSRLIATPDCNSHVEADNGNHTFSPPRQICRAWCRATPRLAARTTSSATLVRSRMHFSHASNYITSANAAVELYITVFKAVASNCQHNLAAVFAALKDGMGLGRLWTQDGM